MATKKAIPFYPSIEEIDINHQSGKGAPIDNPQNPSFTKFVKYQDLGGSGGVVSTVDVNYAAPNLTVTVDGVTDSVALPAGTTNLTYTASPTQGLVNSDTGTDAILPLATGTNAGLMNPTQFTQLSNVTITQPVDLDALETGSHAAMTVTDSGSVDFTLTGQDVTAKITGITAATVGHVPTKGAGDTIIWAAAGGSGATNIAESTRTTTTVLVTSDTGTDATLSPATSTLAGVMPSADKTKVDFITVTQAVDLDLMEADVADLTTLSGVASNAVSLGTFTGAVIADNSTIKVALQSLETALEGNGEFRGEFADASAVNAVLLPQTGDTAYVLNTNTLTNGLAATAGHVRWSGAAWVVYDLKGSATLTLDGLMDNTDFQKLAIQTLVDGATVTLNANSGNYALLALTQDAAFNAPINTVNGELYVVNITATGANRIVTFNTVWKASDGTDMGAITIPSGTSRSFAFQAGPAVLHQIGSNAATSTSISTYSATNGAIVTATGTGVTFARTSLTEWAFTVPDGVELLSGSIYSTTAQNPGTSCFIAFNNAGTRTYNNSTFGTDVKPPKIWGVNMFGNSDGTVAITRANPQNYAATTGATNLVPSLTSVGSGDVEIGLNNYTTALGSQASTVFFHFN